MLLHLRAHRIVRLLALASGLIGLVALCGWLLGLEALKSVLPGAVQMKVNTALGLMLAACALYWLEHEGSARRPRTIRALGAALLALGLATLAQYLLGWNLHIDEVLMRDTARAFNAAPGRMSPYSALVFSGLGAVFVLWHTRWGHPLCILLAELVMGVGAITLFGYASGSPELVTDQLLPPVAIHTALAFVMLGAGLDVLVRLHLDRELLQRPGARTLQRKVLLGMAGSVLLATLGVVITWRTYNDIQSLQQQVHHTQQVRSEVSQHQLALSQAESAMRGYLLSSTRQFRSDSESAAAAARLHLQNLQALLAGQGESAPQLVGLQSLTQRRLEQIQVRMDTLEQRGLRYLQAHWNMDIASTVAAALRTLGTAMEEASTAQLHQQEAAMAQQQRKAIFYLVATLLLTALCFVTLARSIRREVLIRLRAEEELGRANATLEQRVQERGLEIQASYQQFVDLFEFSPEGLIETDTAGTILRINRRAEAIFGWEPGTLLGQGIEVLLPAGLRSRDMALHSNGTPFPVDVSLCTLKTPQGLKTVASVRDTSESQRARQELLSYRDHLEEMVAERTSELEVAKQGAEAATLAKSQFLANMSHEIRTPMNGILGLTYVLERMALGEEAASLVRRIGQTGRTLQAILNDILDFSKIEAGQMQVEHTSLRLGDVLDQVSSLMVGEPVRPEVTLGIQAPPEALAPMQGDALRLGQVLGNLVGNAIKFTHRGSVQLRVTEEGRTPTSVRLHFCVQDSGIGMAPQVMADIFKPFNQADASMTRRYGGTGLGLSISRRLVEMMGGALQARSTPGEGSSFWFSLTLPWAQTQELPELPAQVLAAPQRLGGVRLLVVDDSEVNREVARLIFEAEGARVTLVGDGQQALHWLQAHADDVDVVLMDVQMPVMNGVQATRLLRADPRLRQLPVIALSAGAFAQDRLDAMAAGMDDHVAKPMDVEQALAAIRAQLRRRPASPYPGLDVARALQMWRSAEKYQRFLRQFVAEYRPQVEALETLPEAKCDALVHKLAGAAGSLCLLDVTQAGHAYDTARHANADMALARYRLQSQLRIAWESVQRYLDAEADPAAPAAAVAAVADSLAL